MEKRELSEKELREKKLSLAKGTKYLFGFHVLCGNSGDDKSAAQSQIHRKVSGGSGGELPSGSDHIRHSGRAGVIVDQ